MRTLYFRPGLVSRRAPGCDVLSVTPLLRELIVEAVRVGRLRVRNAHERALRDLTILHISRASSAPTSVALPADSRALALAQAILQNPSQPKALANLCAEAGMSLRTMQRVFQRELGTDFDSWRRQVRLMKAIELLVTGSSVKETAFAIGYNQPSAFVEAFRRAFGATPKAWARSLPNASRLG